MSPRYEIRSVFPWDLEQRKEGGFFAAENESFRQKPPKRRNVRKELGRTAHPQYSVQPRLLFLVDPPTRMPVATQTKKTSFGNWGLAAIDASLEHGNIKAIQLEWQAMQRILAPSGRTKAEDWDTRDRRPRAQPIFFDGAGRTQP
ncbi:hypothetical protein N7468_007019 [Penicillium chermesinum]|uniref:Uncharacterized protein n=1 Tax=Penicillium chermesinum TaxID=63820 RepID=A0A9W9NTE9_9EURO|nr:uncharacterized protein N7468_007019 [Penicillium chermesinum]KAJ5225794.1 hypothetical protein N7468_007019 [Penicillium chermesinum]